jgi:hypothetical protein
VLAWDIIGEIHLTRPQGGYPRHAFLYDLQFDTIEIRQPWFEVVWVLLEDDDAVLLPLAELERPCTVGM